MFTQTTFGVQAFSMESNAAKPPTPAPYPVLVGQATTNVLTADADSAPESSAVAETAPDRPLVRPASAAGDPLESPQTAPARP